MSDTPYFFTDIRGNERVGYRPFFLEDFERNPNSSFRFAGSNNPYHNVQSELLRQFERTGQIIGGEGDAMTYFSKGGTSTDYLPVNLDSKKDVSKNILYETNERFNPRQGGLYNVIAGFDGTTTANQNEILQPKRDARFIDRVNPAQRKGLKVTTFDTTEQLRDPKFKGKDGIRFTSPTSPKVYYDRTKPWYSTGLGQNLKNLAVEGKIFASQPETQAVLKGTGTVAKYGIGGAGLLAYAKAAIDDAPKTVLEWGVPFTPLKMGVGPVLPLGQGSDLESRGRWVYRSNGEPVWLPNDR